MELVERNAEITKRIRAQTVPLRKIASDYGLTKERVRQIGLHEGLRSAMYRRIDATLVARAMELIDRGMPVAHAADSVGLTRDALYQHLCRERLHIPVDARTPWTADEDSFLRRHYKTSAWSASRIGQRLDRTRDECIGRAWRLGLSTPKKRAA